MIGIRKFVDGDAKTRVSVEAECEHVEKIYAKFRRNV